MNLRMLWANLRRLKIDIRLCTKAHITYTQTQVRTNYSGTLTTTNLCIDGVTNSSHILKHLAMHQ